MIHMYCVYLYTEGAGQSKTCKNDQMRVNTVAWHTD